MKTLEERFHKKYTINPDRGCWLWTAATNPAGYGKIGVGYKTVDAHRISWELHRGPISGGMCVLHRCDNPSCVNPEHLFLGTHKENTTDMMNKGRANTAKGSKNGLSKLTEEKVYYIKRFLGLGMTRKKVAEIYNVDPSTISVIATGKTWGHVL